MKEKKYYLKFSVDTGDFVLDVSNKANDFYYAIRKIQLTEAQANEFVELIEGKKRSLNLTMLEFEFDKFFKICTECGTATSKTKWVRRQENRCYNCYQDFIGEKRSEAQRVRGERERVERLKVYAKTEQGKADIAGLEAIKANVIGQLEKHGKTRTELAEALGMTNPKVSQMLNSNAGIKIDYLYKISEWLFIPIDMLLKTPRGSAPVKKKNGVPIIIYKKPIKMVR